MARISLDRLKERAKRNGLHLSCGRPGRETRCFIVVKDPVTGGESNLSNFLNLSETLEWLNGFEKCKDGEPEATRERIFGRRR